MAKKKIIRTVMDKNGNLIKFLIEGTDKWLSKDEAIRRTRAGEIDAVVVTPAKGTPFLRGRGALLHE